VSGPLLDRIDLSLEVPSLPPEALATRGPQRANDATPGAAATSVGSAGESSGAVRRRVTAARELQAARQGTPNARLDAAGVARHCIPDAAGEALLARAMRRLALTARGYHRVLKVARTVADLAGAVGIEASHVTEALGYRHDVGAAGGTSQASA
jgi:magnesium chelatase family protein